MRKVYVAYGDISKVPLSAAAKPLDALLYFGGDLYLEISPRKWVRAIDLPNNHPAWVQLKAGGYKAGLIDASGQTITVLNAYNPEHRQLAARAGLYIQNPLTQKKLDDLLERLKNVAEFLSLERAEQFLKSAEKRIELLEEAKRIEGRAKRLKTKLDQSEWDGVVNASINLAEKISQAIKEAELETKIEESLLLNPELIREMRKMLLA